MNDQENKPGQDDASDSEWDEDLKSKSQLKREVLALTELGEKLVNLGESQLKRIPMPENLESAVYEARRIKSFGARKRQIKYIGRVIRTLDEMPLIQALHEIELEGRRQVEKEHRITRWRDRLMEEGDQALGELLGKRPDLDRQHLRQLIRNGVRERNNNKPPASYRALLRYLREQKV